MTLSSLDTERLRETLTLAETSFGLTEPNPRVGCVIGNNQGMVFGRGATQAAGQAHAEIMALRDAQTAGHDLRGATAWVSLEPCAHHGRTPPCCDALIAAGLARVVIAVGDPFEAVNGAGAARLSAAGIEVQWADAELAAAARDINIGFFSRIERGLPWVRLKAAASLDGCTALANGQSQWITSEESRRDGHAWRRRASAILTGIGTVLADDPLLNVRWVPTARQPLKVLVDSRFRVSPLARIFNPPAPVWVCGALALKDAPPALAQSGASLMSHLGPDGQVDLDAMLRSLATQGINEVHVEAGARLNGALMQAGLVDELLLYLAPQLLGPGRPLFQWPGIESLARAPQLEWKEVLPLGPDLRILALTKPRRAYPC